MNRIHVLVIMSVFSIGTMSAMEPWVAASMSSEKMMAVRKTPSPQTPAQQLQAKQQELAQINNQLKTATGSDRVTLVNRKTQLEKEITILKTNQPAPSQKK